MFEPTMTDAELETVLSRARALSAFFREIGPKYDEENTFAYPSIKAFKDSGLGAVPVPKLYGGLGGDLLATSTRPSPSPTTCTTSWSGSLAV